MVLPCRRLPDDGAKAWAVVKERGYEGMVAKDPRSTFRDVNASTGSSSANVSGDELQIEDRRVGLPRA